METLVRIARLYIRVYARLSAEANPFFVPATRGCVTPDILGKLAVTQLERVPGFSSLRCVRVCVSLFGLMSTPFYVRAKVMDIC